MPLTIPSTGKPRVILGLMTFGPDEAAGARITDPAVYSQVLDVFQRERGYSEVDTARVYVAGAQEAFTRQAGWKDRGLMLATKVKYPGDDGDHQGQKVLESVETSLKELGTDCVDVSCSLFCSRCEVRVGEEEKKLHFEVPKLEILSPSQDAHYAV